jgi:hypothetical protein
MFFFCLLRRSATPMVSSKLGAANATPNDRAARWAIERRWSLPRPTYTNTRNAYL